MPNESRPSFIPRRTPTTPKKQRSSRSIGVFGYLSYILFFGSILLSLGMFIVSQQVQSTLQEKQAELTALKDEFNQSEMDQVQEYELFLRQLTAVFGRSISIGQLFSAIEGSVVESVFMTDLELERTIDALTVAASVQSSSFDTALFQRRVYSDFPVLENFTLEDVALQGAGRSPIASSDGEEGNTITSVLSSDDIVNFSLTFALDTESLPFSPEVLPASTEVESEESDANPSDT